MSAIDPEVARQLSTEFPPQVLGRLVRAFEADLAQQLPLLREAGLRGDAAAWREAAHAIAGAAGGLGAVRLETLSRAAMRPDSQPGPAVAASLEAAAAEALDALRALAG